MACYYPVGTYRLDGTPCHRPCGKCIGCKLEQSRQWAVRCVHESKMHEENSFLTLTYNNENLPDDGSISKRHLQLFIKRLRKSLPEKRIRYYGCGEYGERFRRPHYHVIIFGHDFQDKEIFKAGIKRWKNRFQTGIDHTIYTSENLQKIWKKGFSSIGTVSFESAGYVARYCTKKITGKMAESHYNGRTPEFALMSRRPGIGKPWLDKFRSDVYPKDYFTLRGIKMQPPLYYDSQLKKEDNELYEKIKLIRSKHPREECKKRLWQKDKHRKLITKQLERRLENETE